MNPFKKLIDFIFPKRCIFCNIPIYSGKPYCEQCIFTDSVLQRRMPGLREKSLCLQPKRVVFCSSCRSSLRFGAENAIRQLKFHERISYAPRWQTIFIIS